MASSTPVVVAALIANGAIAVMKFVGFLLTGSPAMLSETYHSVSDTGNQVFLLIGIRYSKQDPDRQHPFGYGKAQFFYAFLVAVLLFGIAGWESLKHGYNAVLHPGHGGGGSPFTLFGTTIDPFFVNVVVLLGAIGFETYALAKANAELQRQIREYEWDGLADAFRKTSDITTLTAFTEDAIALAGAAIALVGVVLARVTGNPIYDAVAAVIIGLLLMGFAVALAWENKRLLVGESLPKEAEERIREAIRTHEGVRHVDRVGTVFFGPGNVIVTADVSFDAGYEADALDDEITAIEAELRRIDDRVGMVYIEPEV
jgi:cation diffusion facilitator family transporter